MIPENMNEESEGELSIRDLLAILEAANAHVPDGYQVAKDTLPERVELMAIGLRSFAGDREILRNENEMLRAALEKFRGQLDCYECTGTAETALDSLEPESDG
jgi:hypothetical protein